MAQIVSNHLVVMGLCVSIKALCIYPRFITKINTRIFAVFVKWMEVFQISCQKPDVHSFHCSQSICFFIVHFKFITNTPDFSLKYSTFITTGA